MNKVGFGTVMIKRPVDVRYKSAFFGYVDVCVQKEGYNNDRPEGEGCCTLLAQADKENMDKTQHCSSSSRSTKLDEK